MRIRSPSSSSRTAISPVAEAEEVLRGEEAEGRRDAGLRDACRAEGLSRILDDRNAELGQLIERRRAAEEVDGHERPRPRRDSRGNVLGVDVQGDRVDVGEHGGGTATRDRLGGGVESERRADDSSPGPISSASSASTSASVPFATPTVAPRYAAASSSKARTFGPRMNTPSRAPRRCGS